MLFSIKDFVFLPLEPYAGSHSILYCNINFDKSVPINYDFGNFFFEHQKILLMRTV